MRNEKRPLPAPALAVYRRGPPFGDIPSLALTTRSDTLHSVFATQAKLYVTGMDADCAFPARRILWRV